MESLRTCKLFGVIRAVLGIKGALPLIHGPVGCFYHIRYLLSLRSGSPIRILSTEMDQNDVVFGAEEKLRQQIIVADEKYSPQLITVLSSCASSIIGENIDQVIEEVKKDIKADIIFINSGGFEGTQIEGYKECLNVLIGLIDEPHLKKDSINLIGLYRGGSDLKILKNYFKRLKIDVSCVLTGGCTLDEIRGASNAVLNISMCDASAIEPCELMEKKFGIPFLQETLPLGVRASSKFFKVICNALNKEYLLKKDEIKAQMEINKIKPYLKDKKVIIVAGATRAVALVDFLSDIGMDPILIGLDFEGNNTMKNLERLIKQDNINPKILREPDYYDILNYAKDLEPDIILGGMGEFVLSRELKIPLMDVMHAQEITFGFEGATSLVKTIKETLETKKI
ncbi:MAG: nitrogenase component 1 [Methanobacterium sp.]|nr:nitrogenase component 1 [Methanobacterium sp.]